MHAMNSEPSRYVRQALKNIASEEDLPVLHFARSHPTPGGGAPT